MLRIIAAGFLAWTLCGAESALAQVKLEQKYQPKTEATTLETFNLTAKVQVAGQNVDIAGNSRITQTTEYLPAADNLIPIRTTIVSAAIGSTADGQTYMFDTTLPNAARPENPEFEKEVYVIKAVVGNPLTYQIGGDGRVVRVEGIQAVISKAPAEAVKSLEERLNEQRLKDEFEQQVRLLPDTPVQPGDSWKRIEQVPVQGGSNLVIDRTYTYQGTIAKESRQLDQIKIADEAVRLTLGQNDIGLTLKECELKIESSEGTMLFDRELGAVIERNVTTRVVGKVTLQANGADLPVDLDLKFTKSSVRQR